MACDLRDAGTLQHLVGVCRVGGPKGRDLCTWMVKRGWARAAGRYAALENAAKASGIAYGAARGPDNERCCRLVRGVRLVHQIGIDALRLMHGR